MTSIYLVRHGQTAWNKEEVFRGRTDIPLNETGLKEAAMAADYFVPLQLDAIYSSPLARAWQTAQEIAKHHTLQVQPLAGLIDMSFGSWEGRPLKEVRENDRERYRLWAEEPHRVEFPGGETLEQVRVRAMAALESVIEKHPEKTVILVSHRVINKVLLCAVLGLDNSHFWQLAQDTTAINLIKCKNGNYILSLMNESCHVKALQAERTRKDF